MFNPWFPPGHFREVLAGVRDVPVTDATRARCDLDVDGGDVVVAATVVAAAATVHLEEDARDEGDMQKETENDVPQS